MRKDVGEVKRAKDDGRLPMNDHNTRIVVLGTDGREARYVFPERPKGSRSARGPRVHPGVLRVLPCDPVVADHFHHLAAPGFPVRFGP